MADPGDIHTGRHCVFALHAHVVFVTKYQHRVFSDQHLSRRLRQEFPDLVRHYYRTNRLWSASYFAGSVGRALLSVLQQYIEQQNRPAQGTLGP
ncbi:transposase [Micromonospora ureilytica]